MTPWRAIQLEDRKAYSESSDVLRPTTIPLDATVQAYVTGNEIQANLAALRVTWVSTPYFHAMTEGAYLNRSF